MLRSLAKKFRFFSDDRGVVAVEFTFVILPFVALSVAIIEIFIEQAFVTYLDNAVQKFAADLRSGVVILRNVNSKTAVEKLLSDRLCPQLTVLPGFSCKKLQVQLFKQANCANAGTVSCWDSQYTNFTNAVRKPAAFLTSGLTFQVGSSGDSQYLTVYYPFPKMSAIWNNAPTTTVNGEQVYGLLSTAMWVNDPSIAIF